MTFLETSFQIRVFGASDSHRASSWNEHGDGRSEFCVYKLTSLHEHKCRESTQDCLSSRSSPELGAKSFDLSPLPLGLHARNRRSIQAPQHSGREREDCQGPYILGNEKILRVFYWEANSTTRTISNVTGPPKRVGCSRLPNPLRKETCP